MKSPLTILTVLALMGCAEHEPTALPQPPLIDSGVWIWLLVVDSSGGCIHGATIQVVAGQRVGEPITQVTPCDAWAYSGGVEVHNLTAGLPMTLRAAAPGYAAQDTTLVPVAAPVSAIVVALLPLR